MLWGMWEKVKTMGELEKSWGSSKNPWGSHFVGAVTEGCETITQTVGVMTNKVMTVHNLSRLT